MKAATWNRISHKTETDILKNMIRDNKAYVLDRGWTLVDEYKEVLTSKGITPGLEQFLKDAEAGKFDMAVFKSTSRMTRGGKQYAIAAVERLAKAGVHWVFTEQSYLNWDSGVPEWVRDMLLVMWAGLDKEYRKTISVNTKRTLDAQKAAGTYRGGAGHHKLPCRCVIHRTSGGMKDA